MLGWPEVADNVRSAFALEGQLTLADSTGRCNTLSAA
jgi:hypothetical protein